MLFHAEGAVKLTRRSRRDLAARARRDAVLLECAAPDAPWFVWSGDRRPVASCRVVEPAASCSSYAEARRVARELARQHGSPFVIRRVGVVVARVHPCGIVAIPKGAAAALGPEATR